MPNPDDVLILRDEDGVPFVLPKDVVFANEFVSLKIGNDAYLVEPKAMAEAQLTGARAESAKRFMEATVGSAEPEGAEHAEAGAHNGGESAELLHTGDGRCFLISQEVLDRSVVPPELKSVAEELMVAGLPEVEGHVGPLGRAARVRPGDSADPLGFAVERINQIGVSGRGAFTTGSYLVS